MIGSLWTGSSGLSSHQRALDNESNNIANVNTVGFKSSRISFSDQVYQDKVGKGSKVLDAEKLFNQGTTNTTGVAYDMALKSDGFFTVSRASSTGTSELYYTRAGNFRMGENGTLQDSSGNEVQGWIMSPIDTDSDVITTNPGVNAFTNDYTKLAGNKVIRHSSYVDTITAKTTDYNSTAKSDSKTVFDGIGYKTKATKIADVEAAISDYKNWLQKLADNPDDSSESSVAQITQINFKSGSDALVSKEGDQISVTINGNKLSQKFLEQTASSTDRVEIYESLSDTQKTEYN